MLTNDDLLEIEREYCRRSLGNFVKRGWHVLEPATDLKWGWVVDLICEHLEAVTDGDIKRLLINVPPGTMKSLLTNVFWPAWEWGPRGMPEKRFMATAHSQNLAIRDNTKCRRLIQSEWYQSLWPTELAGDQNAKTKFENKSTGFRECMAFTSMTGSRGDRALLDDPHSVDSAGSAVMLASSISTFREALPSRVNSSDSAIVIIMQRLHEEDISSVALELGYDHLCIPMRYEKGASKWVVGEGDPRTTEGELMFPERFNEEDVAALEKSLMEYGVASQLQQRPAPRTGGIINAHAIEIVDALPKRLKMVRGWDLAATKDAGDATAGVLIGECPDGIIYFCDVVHARASADGVEQMLVSTGKMDTNKVLQSIPQDPGQAGKAQASYLSRKLRGIRFRFSTESGDKLTRASGLIAQINAGNVKMLRAPWNKDVINEFSLIPRGKHDDILDAASRAYNEMGSTYSLDNI